MEWSRGPNPSMWTANYFVFKNPVTGTEFWSLKLVPYIQTDLNLWDESWGLVPSYFAGSLLNSLMSFCPLRGKKNSLATVRGERVISVYLAGVLVTKMVNCLLQAFVEKLYWIYVWKTTYKTRTYATHVRYIVIKQYKLWNLWNLEWKLLQRDETFPQVFQSILT